MGFGDKLKQILIDQKIKEEYWSVGDNIDGLYNIELIITQSKNKFWLSGLTMSKDIDLKLKNTIVKYVKEYGRSIGKVKKTEITALINTKIYPKIEAPKYVFLCKYYCVKKNRSVGMSILPVPAETRYNLIGFCAEAFDFLKISP